MKTIIFVIFILFSSFAYSQFVNITPDVEVLRTNRCFYFTNKDNGYLNSKDTNKYKLFHTSDGGNSWKIVNSNIGKIKFINDSIGFMEGVPIRTTKDYGKTFQDATNPPGISSSPSNIYVRRRGDIFAEYGGSGVFKSSDLGKSWVKVFDDYLRNIHFINDSVGFASSYDFDLSQYFIYKTYDKGNSWQKGNKVYFSSFNLQFVNQDTAYVIYSTKGALRSYNGGTSWDTCFDEGEWIYGLQFITPTTGFLVDQSGIFKTTDAGNTWSKIAPPQDANEMQVFYENSKVYIYLNMFNAGYTSILRGVFDSTQIWNSTKDLSKMSLNEKFKVYPNPAQSKLTITYTGFIASGTRARLYDMQGKLVKEQNLSPGKTTMGIGGLQKGMYLLKVNTGEGEFVEKVVKE